MAKTSAIKATVYFLLLAIAFQCANSVRFLDEVDAQLPVNVDDMPDVSPIFGTTLPSGQFPAVAPVGDGADGDILPPDDLDVATPPVVDVVPVVAAPVTALPNGVNPISPVSGAGPNVNSQQVLPNTANGVNPISPVSGAGPNVNSQQVLPNTPSTGSASTVSTTASGTPASLSFYMHDILGGTQPSTRVVTGIIANSGENGLPFSVPNGQVFPTNGGVPLPNNINGIINNNNNIPFLTGLNTGSQSASTILQNNGNNNVLSGGNQPFVTAGQLPSGATLRELMFGTITVIDDELTEGHELGSAVLGRAQGFYLASSLDGTSHTMALTTIFHGGEHEEDTVSFFGVHRTAALESHIAIIGGTGKYENAKGHATIGSIHMEDQHTTDGVDAILQINVYLSH